MHRGVREFVRWVEENKDSDAVSIQGPASARAVSALEHQLGALLPADLKYVLGVFDGASLPNGTMLSARPGPGTTIEAALKEVAEAQGTSFLDPELPIPFHRTEHGSYLAFDRSAAPVSDTWPIVDYDVGHDETRLVHRTLDGWCLLCVNEWTSSDYTEEFTVDKYLRQGERHAQIEPDVSVAHVTVGHALRRAGEPGKSLDAYLRAGRCVPAIAWSDWEALKLASVLGRGPDALEAATRLAKRAPASMWEQRDTTPSRVAYALGLVMPSRPDEDKEPWMRVFDQLVDQALDDADRTAASGIRQAIVRGEPLPSPHPPAEPAVESSDDLDAWFEAIKKAYATGELRDENLVLDPEMRRLADKHVLAEVLRIRRDF